MKATFGRRVNSLLIALFMLSLIALVSAAALPAALAKDYLVSDSKDWRDIYLVATAASLSNKSFLFFSNLGEAEIVMKMIQPGSKVDVYEPNTGSVVKNYQKYLELNGKPATTVSYNGYGELQSKLFSRGYDGYVLLDPRFGLEAITSSPLILLKKYPPLFLTKDTLSGINSITNGKSVILAGRIPVRLVNQFNDATKITGMYSDNMVELVKLAYEAKPGNSWGIIGKIDKVDLDIIQEGNPIMMYYGDTDTIMRSLNATPRLTNFEVISGDMADMARGFRTSSGRDLKLILKFAQTYTNLPGQVGKLFDLNTVSFDYPIEDLSIQDIKYYPDMGIIAVTFRNRGNIDVSFFTAIEFSGNALIDNNTHTIAPGETRTIPYLLEGVSTDTLTTVINTRYGMTTPFRKAIESPDGGVVLIQNATTDNEKAYSFLLEPTGADYYNSRGTLVLKLKNPTDKTIVAFGEIMLGQNSVLASPPTKIGSGEEGLLSIDTPYLTAADLTQDSYNVTVYYGEKDTLLSQTFKVKLAQKQELITSLITLAGSPTILIPLAILIIALILFFILRRRKKDKKGRRRF